MVSLWIHNIFFMPLTYYNIKVKSLCVWGSQNLSSDKYVPRYLIRQRLSTSSGQRVSFKNLKKNEKKKKKKKNMPFHV